MTPISTESNSTNASDLSNITTPSPAVTSNDNTTKTSNNIKVLVTTPPPQNDQNSFPDASVAAVVILFATIGTLALALNCKKKTPSSSLGVVLGAEVEMTRRSDQERSAV